jgi:GntR family transcriptional repressor for pyruvate dehydrogenase complex
VLVSDDVFRRLTEDILSGRYEPGEKLPTQRTLAADLGVNMASVREAVKRLEQLRLVEVRHGDAMRVADWRTAGGLDVLAHLLFRAGGLDQQTLEALMEARALMLSEAARLAAGRRSDEQAAQLTETAERIAQAPDHQSAQALDWAFYATVVDAAGNLVLALVMNSIRHVYFQRADLFAKVVDDHEELAPLYADAADAIARHDADAAAAATAALARAQAERLRR